MAGKWGLDRTTGGNWGGKYGKDFDLASRKLIAPRRVYADFTGGTYAVYHCRQSVRVRIDHICGENAVSSGVFFDPARP